MKISLSFGKSSLKFWSVCLAATFLMFTPFGAFCQDEEQQDQDVNAGSSWHTQPAERPGPVVGSNSPWGNSGGATIGTRSDYSTNNGTAGTSSSGANRAVSQRPGGATIDGRDPPGNPDVDVPFDDNMNLMFLAAAIAFGVWVVKKRLSTKAEAIKND